MKHLHILTYSRFLTVLLLLLFISVGKVFARTFNGTEKIYIYNTGGGIGDGWRHSSNPAWANLVGTHTAGGDNISTGAAVEEGTAVNLVATPETGYAFFGWRDANGSIVSTAANYVFSMPSTNVSLTAVFYTESTDPVIEDCDGCFLIR